MRHLVLVTAFGWCAVAVAQVASPYVPIDNWVYPLLDRMIARGEITNDATGLRPWTRLQIASLLAVNRVQVSQESEELRLLRDEFWDEIAMLEGKRIQAARIDSVYLRAEQITGAPLTNGFDFGETVVNDYGRSHRQGQNLIAGTESHIEYGRFAAGVRAEFQHSPAMAPLSGAAYDAMVRMDGAAAAGNWDGRAVNRLRFVEAYASTSAKGIQVSIGKQSLQWGPTWSGPMLMSNNAEPINMLRVRNANAFRLPGVLRYLGHIRGELFMGKLGGHVQPLSPWLQGQKITLEVTENLEFGFSRTIVFAGGGRPLLRSFGRSFFSMGSNATTTPGSAEDVGDRRGGFDFQYRLPKMRRHVTFYGDSFTDDDPSPLSAPHRAAFASGIYFAQLPRLPRVDLRLEGLYTDAPGVRGNGQYFYVNGGYAQSYTNNGHLLGSWIGRSGKAAQGWSTFWISPTNSVQLGVRGSQISSGFVPGGGRQWDGAVRYSTKLRQGTLVTGKIQYEQWRFPVLDSATQSNLSISIELQIRMPGQFVFHSSKSERAAN